MIINNVNPNKLLDQFLESGVIWTSAKTNMEFDGNGNPVDDIADLTVEFAEGMDMDLVQSIIDEHDPTPIPSQPTDTDRIAMLEDTINFLLGL